MRTLVELFDECQIKNVIAGMRFKPERIIYVGFKEIMRADRVASIKKLFEMKGINATIEEVVVGRFNYEKIVDVLTEIAENCEDCCFDLTGGRELLLTAMGAVSASCKVPMIQMNIKTGGVINVSNFPSTEKGEDLTLRVAECVALNGGAIITDMTESWDITPDFKKDIFEMWRIMATVKPWVWNKQCNTFERIEKFGKADGLYVESNIEKMKKDGEEVFLNKNLIDELIGSGFLSDYRLEENGNISYLYKNKQVRQCLKKAGNILEVYAYIAAKEIEEEAPGHFDDITVGVQVDWDGILYDEDDEVTETKNEIDLILTKNLIPIFVSCKNGQVSKEALYELDTMAKKFGGEFARKMLLTTYLNPENERNQYIFQRAEDMNIKLINGIDSMSFKDFKDSFR